MDLAYGIIGNCKTAALVSEKASIDWCCFPRFDSESVFAKILDEKNGGSFEIKPLGKYKIRQRYIKDTNVLETVFYNNKNKFKIIDFFLRYREKNKIVKENKIHRIIKVLNGSPKVKIIYNPKLNYARATTKLKLQGNSIIAKNKKQILYLYSDITLKDILNKKPIRLKKNAYFVLSFNEECNGHNIEIIEHELKKTIAYWHDFVNKARWTKFYKNEVIRSALVLKLLTYDETGAIIAAATTSLPEIIKGNRNWDYRYCWLRDSSFTINALTKICHHDEALDYMRYLRRIALTCDISKKNCDLDIQVVYGISGEKQLKEKILKHLSGYKNSWPVRIGNSAYKQKQIDVAGEVIDTIHEFYVHYRYVKNIDDGVWRLVVHLVNYVIKEWKNKDHGIWEFRKIKEHFTFSKLLSWVTLDKAIEIAKFFKKKIDIQKWENAREEIKHAILRNSFNKNKRAFTMFYGSKDLDASVLLMPYYGFIDAKDEKMRGTIAAIEKELIYDCLVLRYKRKDDFGSPKNAFSICTFWFIDALYLNGQKKKAKFMFKNMLKYSNHLGLYSEDIDLNTKELTGNFPQAYTHIALINSAILLNRKNIKRPVCRTHL
jgi:GH15 family glucan-1,4-alpha-glucosidase